MKHEDIAGPYNHVLHNWTYADAAARVAASGFVAGDVHKVALQSDNNSLWMLTDDSPITWERKDGSGTVGTVTASGTPTSGQIAEWTSATNVQGKAVTGSGNVVLANSPTLVTPALGTPSAVALTNATAVPAGQVIGVIPIANLATGTPDGTKFIKDDGTLAVPAGGMTNPMTTAGDSIVGGASGAPTRLALGTSLQERRVNFAGTAQEWGPPNLKHFPFSFNPKAVCDGTIDRLFLMTVGPEFPNGLKITRWNVSFDADPTTEADLDFKRADAFIGVANAAVVDVLDTAAGVSSETTAANINSDAAVANGKVLYLEFGTAYTADNLQIIFEFWGYAV